MSRDQDLPSSSKHGSTGSGPDISETPPSFQGSVTSVKGEVHLWSSAAELDAFLQSDFGAGVFCGDLGKSGVGGSLQSCKEKPEEDDQKPQEGMAFSSLNQAKEFYSNYAKKTGFTVRSGKTYKQPDGKLKWQRFLCSCEGFRAKKQSNQGTKYQRLETRTGCKAHMQVTLIKEKWVITNLHLDHNHCLNSSNQSLEMMDGLSDIVEEEHSAIGNPESSSSMAKPSDEIESPCGNQLPMGEGSLPVVGSASLPTFIPTPNLAFVTMTSCIQDTLPFATMTSCLQDEPSGATTDEGKQSTNLGRVSNTVAPLSHADEKIWQQILNKHGDIIANCIVTSSEFVAFFKQCILNIVELLLNKTVCDLSDEDISIIGSKLSDLERLQVNVDWLRRQFAQVVKLFDNVKEKKSIEQRIMQLTQALDQERAHWQKLQSAEPGWLTVHDKLGKGLL